VFCGLLRGTCRPAEQAPEVLTRVRVVGVAAGGAGILSPVNWRIAPMVPERLSGRGVLIQASSPGFLLYGALYRRVVSASSAICRPRSATGRSGVGLRLFPWNRHSFSWTAPIVGQLSSTNRRTPAVQMTGF